MSPADPSSLSPDPASRGVALVVVGGSMAAVKAPSALRRLREAGFQTQVIATAAALQFVTPLSLSTAADSTLHTDQTWFASQPGAQHLELARANVVVCVGASADLLARAATGRADDLASATLLSVRAPVLWVPAMNERMWLHPAVQANVTLLKSRGGYFLGPEYGSFGSSGEGEGLGRMAEPETIAAAAWALLDPLSSHLPTQDLRGVKVVVSAGPTREYLDPVRFISNPSSGKMGFAVAQAARDRGAEVVLVAGPVNLPDPPGMQVRHVESALELRDVVLDAADEAQMVIMTAAVADYRAFDQATEKQAKVAQEVSIRLVPNPDILAELGSRKGGRVLVGFAMETHAGVERAATKAQRKNADFILLNYPIQDGTLFGSDDNQVTLVRPDGSHEAWPRMSKLDVAHRLLNEAATLLPTI